MADYRRPDVYIEEKTSFPVSILEVESAIPVFIGYTAEEPTPGEPIQINSLEEYENNFGEAHAQSTIDKFSFVFDPDTRQVEVEPKSIVPQYFLHYAIRHYFKNGGSKCFVISCGKYPQAFDAAGFKTKVESALDRALEIEEVTLFVIPELVKLATLTPGDPNVDPPTKDSINYSDLSSIVSGTVDKMLKKQKLEKFFILDVVNWSKLQVVNEKDEFDKSDFSGLSIERSGEFMAFYYPYLETNYRLNIADATIDALTTMVKIPGTQNPVEEKTLQQLKEMGEGNASTDPPTPGNPLRKGLYEVVKQQIKSKAPLVLLPPSAAMAGIYVKTDNARGVWKAPANVGINDIKRPGKFINDTVAEDLNINPLNGRSICAIRTIPGLGTRVMGGRTLRGSSNDYRYISVRRFVSIVEKSIKNTMKQYLFEPNSPVTWGLVKGGIGNYLTLKWQQGALLGAKAEDSFFVRIGLGTTMTQDDVLNGKMIVEVGLAVVRPAEFIILRFEQFLPTQLS
ncbi:MAG: phage tail sheath family protein [Saprospiraceae bacterium]|nr:phage tail sheath family protein [Saprospiraceae bacterium]